MAGSIVPPWTDRSVGPAGFGPPGPAAAETDPFSVRSRLPRALVWMRPRNARLGAGPHAGSTVGWTNPRCIREMRWSAVGWMPSRRVRLHVPPSDLAGATDLGRSLLQHAAATSTIRPALPPWIWLAPLTTPITTYTQAYNQTNRACRPEESLDRSIDRSRARTWLRQGNRGTSDPRGKKEVQGEGGCLNCVSTACTSHSALIWGLGLKSVDRYVGRSVGRSFNRDADPPTPTFVPHIHCSRASSPSSLQP